MGSYTKDTESCLINVPLLDDGQARQFTLLGFFVSSHHLHSVALHVVVDVYVFLRDGNAAVPCQTGKHANANALGCQGGDETASH